MHLALRRVLECNSAALRMGAIHRTDQLRNAMHLVTGQVSAPGASYLSIEHLKKL